MNIFITEQFAGYAENNTAWESAASPVLTAGRHELARELALLGQSVTVAAGCPEDIFEGSPFVRRERDGVEYLLTRAPSRLPGERLALGKTLVFSNTLRENAELLAKLSRPDAVISASGAAFDLPGAAALANASGAPLIWELSSIEPEGLIAGGELGRLSPAALWLRSCSRRAAAISARIASPLINADKWLERRGAAEKLVIVPEAAADLAGIPCEEALPALDMIAKLRGEGRFTAVYAGDIKRPSALLALILAAKKLGGGFAVVLAGSGGGKVLLRREAKAAGADNVYFYDGLPPEGEQAVSAAGDCAFAFEPPLAAPEYGAPAAELIKRMLSGSPVIYASAHPPAMLAKTGCGFAVEPGNADSAALALRRLSALSQTERRDAGEAGRAYALERHTYKKQAERWLRILTEITEG